MKKIVVSLICCAVLMACTPSPTTDMSTTAVKQYVNEKTNSELQVFVESQKDTDGDFNNLQRELKVAFLLPENSSASEIMLPNGLMLKRGVRSVAVTALVVHAKDGSAWKTIKIELPAIVK
jgi:hypothetical protein